MAKTLSRQAVAEYFADALIGGQSINKLALEVSAYLIETRRTKEVGIMIRDIQHSLAIRGYVLGSVTTAHDLGQDIKKAIETYAKKSMGAKNVELDYVVDESVLGGFKLDLPGSELNATIAHQLTILKTKFKKV